MEIGEFCCYVAIFIIIQYPLYWSLVCWSDTWVPTWVAASWCKTKKKKETPVSHCHYLSRILFGGWIALGFIKLIIKINHVWWKEAWATANTNIQVFISPFYWSFLKNLYLCKLWGKNLSSHFAFSCCMADWGHISHTCRCTFVSDTFCFLIYSKIGFHLCFNLEFVLKYFSLKKQSFTVCKIGSI